MKKYLIITKTNVYTKEELTKRDLNDANLNIIGIINLKEQTFFSHVSYTWENITEI